MPTKKRLRHHIRRMQESAWDQLYVDLDHANNAAWSIASANTARAIVKAARLVGATNPEAVPWPLLAGGVYDKILDVADITHIKVSEEELVETEKVMVRPMNAASVPRYEAGLARCRERYAGTVAALDNAHEIDYIRAHR